MVEYLRFLKKHLLLVILVSFTSISFAQNRGLVQGKIRIKIVEDVQLVVSKNLEVSLSSAGVIQTGIPQLDALNKEFSVSKMRRVFPYAGKNEAKHIKHGLHLWYELDVNNSADLNSVSNKYLSTKDVISAEPIYAKTLGDSKVIKATLDGTLDGLPTNDPGLVNQWHYDNTGQEDGFVPGDDISLFDAWKSTMGDRNVIVAVVDGGIDVNHSDLKDNVWINEVELNGTEGVDDDNNGYIDDINGYNFPSLKGQISPHFHGTHVAGTIAAVNNNGIGVAGIAGGSGNNDGVRLMSCQTFDDENGSGYFAPAIVYGADNGAVISQNSWGYQTPGAVEQVVLDAIDYFREEAGNYPGSPMKGGIVFFSAGNDGKDNVYYPGYYDGAISVAATGPSNSKAGYSNFGEWVDISAPGGDNVFGLQGMILSTIPGEEYGYLQGTSMACPHVSGVAALVVSKYGSDYFTRADLESRMLLGVDNIDAENPGYIGKMGSGLINTAKALTNNESTPPQRVDDFSILGVSKDFAALTWTVPLDVDDDVPNKYFLYFSENEITADNLAQTDFVVVENKGKEYGDKIIAEVAELKELTKYYFAIVASDRWGNNSELSQVVSTTTNEGSQIGTDVSSLFLSVDINTSNKNSDLFNVLNQKNGILKWSLEPRNISNRASYTSVSYPANAKTITTSSARASKQLLEEDNVEHVPSASLQWESSKIQYWTYRYPSYLFGSLDTTYTNSMATKFVIDNEDGFNLTHVNAMLRGDEEDGPFIIEIYKGTSIQNDNRIYFDNEYYELQNKGENYINTRIIQLKENIFFDKGDVFWVVIHSPSNNKYPFGIYPETAPSYSDNCLWSTDMGATWESLENGVGSPDFVWAIALESSMDPLYKYVTVNPSEGKIYGVDSKEIEFVADASKLINGTYYSNMVFMSNDDVTPFYRVPLTVNVTGHKPKLTGPSIVEFGRVFNGLKKELKVTLTNNGYGRFNTATAVSSDSQFNVVSSIGNLNIAGLSSRDITIEYEPSGVGNDNAEITLTAETGEIFSFNVFGMGASPAKIELPKSEFNFDDVAVGEELTANVTIKNVGGYPLQYGFPAFADDLSNIEEVSLDNQNLGYSYNVSDYPTDFVFNDISETGTDITKYFIENAHFRFYKIDLGFTFPYFGQELDSLYITPHGMLTVNGKGFLGNNIKFMENFIDGYISGMHLRNPVLSKTGKVTYKKGLGFTTVQYTDFKENNSYDNVSLTFQIIVFDNGDIKFVYDKMDGIPSYSQGEYYVAIESEDKKGGIELKNVSGAHKIVDIHSPGIGIVKSVSEPTGTIATGASKTIVMTLDSDKLTEGTFNEKFYVMSNDPFAVSKELTINVNVTHGGSPQLSLENNSISVGDVINNSEVINTVIITNNGDKSTQIVSATSSNSKSELLDILPVTIKPGQIMYANVSVKTDVVGPISDVLKLTDTEGKTYSVNIDGNVVESPHVVLSAKEFSEVLDVNQVVRKDLLVENTGEGMLEYSFVDAGLARVEPSAKSAKTNDIPEFTYVTKTSYKNDDVSFRWYNVGEENQFPFNHLKEIYWSALELPFEFEFYEQKYSTVYVNMQGVVSFDEPVRDDVFMFPAVPKLGEDDYLNNYIAPYFAGQDLRSYEISGVYYKVLEDKLVIEWKNLIDRSALGAPYSFQLILFKDGRIKFQYNTYNPESGSITNLGYVGLENKDASDYLLIASFSDFVSPKVAVEIIPSYKETLAPGQSKSYDVVLDATNQLAGEFTQKIGVVTNEPNNEFSEINVNMSINGEPKIVFEEDIIDLGEVFISENPLTSERFINIKNGGLKELKIRNIHLEHEDDIEMYFLYKHPFFGARWEKLGGLRDPSYTIYPEEELKEELKIVFTPSNTKYLNSPYRNKVILTTNYGTYKANLVITADYSLPPVFTVNTDSIYHVVNNNDTISDKLILQNIEGLADLRYSVALDYQRVSTLSSTLSTAVNNAELTSASVDNSLVAPSSVNEEEFYRVLSYENNLAADSRLGFNGAFIFSAANAFMAPEDGFKLTHVQSWYVPGEILESDIEIEIRAGATLEEATIIHTQTVHHSVSELDDAGSLLTFELDKPITLLPYERFYVIFSYPQEATYPQGFAQIDNEILTNTFFVFDGNDSWIDLAITSFEKARFIIRAAQKEAENLHWIEVDELEGTVAKGGTKDLTFKMYPKNAPTIDNNVVFVISTNDPMNQQENVRLVLRINQGPQAVFADNYSVREMDTLKVIIPIVDVEGDKIVSVKLLGDNETATLTYNNGEATFIYIPTYDDQGVNTFEIETVDNVGKTSSNQFSVDVENVNRAPVVIDDSNVLIDTDNIEYKRDFTQIFEELDGQSMTFTAEIENTEIAELFISESGIVVKPVKTGFTRLHLTATDEDGAMVNEDKVVVVNALLSDEEILASQWSVSPNPVDNILRIELGNMNDTDIEINIFNSAGVLVKSIEKTEYNRVINQPINGLDSGIYFVELINSEGKSINKMMKI